MNTNNNIGSKWVFAVVLVLVLIGALYYWTQSNPDVVADLQNDMASTTEVVATSTATSTDMGTSTNATDSNGTNGSNTTAKAIPGYPANWPSDVPRYPVASVKYTAPTTSSKQAVVVFSSPDAVSAIVNFYLNGLRANGWTITESGNGNANLVTIRATKGTRTVGGYVARENGRTNVTIGIGAGI